MLDRRPPRNESYEHKSNCDGTDFPFHQTFPLGRLSWRLRSAASVGLEAVAKYRLASVEPDPPCG